MPTQAELDKKSGRSTKTSTAKVVKGGAQAQLDAQNTASKERQQETRRAKIHDVDTTRTDDNKEGTDERIQNDGIDRIENPLTTGDGGGGIGNDTVTAEYIDGTNTPQTATFVIVT